MGQGVGRMLNGLYHSMGSRLQAEAPGAVLRSAQVCDFCPESDAAGPLLGCTSGCDGAHVAGASSARVTVNAEHLQCARTPAVPHLTCSS